MELINVNGYKTKLKALSAGPADGNLVIVVHGFPDTPRSFERLIEKLSELGYCVIAPFQRGYYPSPIPPDGNVQVGALAMDVIAIHDEFSNGSKSVIVGHDYGAMAAYGAAN